MMQPTTAITHTYTHTYAHPPWQSPSPHEWPLPKKQHVKRRVFYSYIHIFETHCSGSDIYFAAWRPLASVGVRWRPLAWFVF